MAQQETRPALTVERWEHGTEWPLVGVAVVFLVAYAWPILDPHITSGWHHACHIADYATWVVFAVDYAMRLVLATQRPRYFFRHLPDLAVVVLPVLRPLRLLRLVLFLRVLNRRATNSLRGRVALYVGGATAILIFCAALAVLDAERGKAGANIEGFGDALWWAATTVSTVGYGDHFPVTAEGRWVAVGLMIGGVALIGVVTGSFATWLVDRVRASDEAAQAATRRDVHELTEQLAHLTKRLEEHGLV
ncbi:potassium channel family protein [uncultured Jatrophihabitans sp.]|uniref:potassium channel family protein n=1 Tax=uncultured Jatrophihabitans sp. TaxID=1610747 RepID=UPI0035C9F141